MSEKISLDSSDGRYLIQSIILERFLILSSIVGNSIASNNAC